jgi:CRISPR/Cas system-associated protein endoribonuclease Cas2
MLICYKYKFKKFMQMYVLFDIPIPLCKAARRTGQNLRNTGWEPLICIVYHHMKKKWMMNTETIWKETVIGLIEALSQHLPGGTKENHENLCQDNNCSSRD